MGVTNLDSSRLPVSLSALSSPSMKTFILVAFLLLTIGTRVSAQAGEVDLNFAFTQLKGNGSGPFSKALFVGDQESATQLVNQLSPLLKSAGDYSSFELVSRRNLTKRIERLVIVVYFENFPVYMRIDSYENSKGRIFLPAKFSKEAAEILPFDLISASGK